ncbi:MAG: HEPN domain-containing protein [Bacteroidales bacterium]|jgi:HEPN domain-containing protein|nr:HEPN domain-containing protein [Bacteroidales bacterium]
MKQSIAHLPKRKQDDLLFLVKSVLELIPETQMIILYGSYATGKYVERDERIESGRRISYMSDYDILIVTHGIKDKIAGQKLDVVEQNYYTDPDLQTPVQFINDDIKKLNKDLSEGRYFYTQIKKEGILLYNNGRFKLARRRKLRYDEIKKQAEEYFVDKYRSAEEFLEIADFTYSKGWYKKTAFNLHQTCENLFYAVRLVFTLENSKQHNLSKLLASVKSYSNEFVQVFPRQTAEEKRLFDLIKSAYVEARYIPEFQATKKDIEALIPTIDRFFELVKRLCEERIREYAEKA